jgi:PilZ domain
MLANKRRYPRRELKWEGLVVNIDGSIVGQCSIANVSATGAKIVPSESMAVPDEFILVLSKKGHVRRHCKVARRSKADVGIQFVY